MTAAGCARLPPSVLQGSANDYNIAVQNTVDEQLLLNLVRLRYRDNPLFLEVSSVSSQFTLQNDISTSASFVEDDLLERAGIGVDLSYRQVPTLTYSPLQGEQFVEKLLAPVSIRDIVLLVNAGWSIERVLLLAAAQINYLENAVNAASPTPTTRPSYEDFLRFAGVLRQLQRVNAVSVASRSASGEGEPQYLLRVRPGAVAELGLAQAFIAAGLEPNATEFLIVPGFGEGQDGKTLYLAPRSMLGALYYLSHTVAVPAQDAAAGRVTVTLDETGEPFDWSSVTGGIFQVASASEKPAATRLRTRYRGTWFYIVDDDLESKSTFALLSQLFALQAGRAGNVQMPVLTLPIGN